MVLVAICRARSPPDNPFQDASRGGGGEGCSGNGGMGAEVMGGDGRG